MIMQEPSKPRGTAELYDSGCANHLSPYQHLFQNFEDIAPRKERAANQQMFSTAGKGELVVDVLDRINHY